MADSGRQVEIRIHRERGHAALRRGLVVAALTLTAVLGFAVVSGRDPAGTVPVALFAATSTGVVLGLLRYSTADVDDD